MRKIAFAALSSVCLAATAAEITVMPSDDLVANVATANNGDTVTLSAGTFEIAQQIAISGKSDITFVGAGKDKTFIVVKDGVSSRHVSLDGMTNVKFEGISFRNGLVNYDTTAGSNVGGSFFITSSTGVMFDNCSFVSNLVQNTTVADTTTIAGGAIYAKDSVFHCEDCLFEENGAVYATSTKKDTAVRGGVFYVTAPTGASASVLRLNVTATNCIFRSNYLSSFPSGTPTMSQGGVMWLDRAGADFYNCLVTGTYTPHLKDCRPVRELFVCYEAGGFHRYTQCTFAYNCAATCFSAAASGNKCVRPVLIRSVVAGHWRDLDDINQNVNAILIDSVYTSGQTPIASQQTICGKSFKSSNYLKVDTDDVLERDCMVVVGSAAATRDAGWRPAVAPTFHDWYVAATDGASDANVGTQAAPFRTISKAVSVCGNGDKIIVGEGTYSQTTGEVFPIDLSGKRGVSILGAGRDATIVDGEDNTKQQSAFVLNKTHQFRIEDLAITRMNTRGTASEKRPMAFNVESSARPIFKNLNIVNNRLTPGINQAMEGLIKVDFSEMSIFDGCLVTNNIHKLHSNGSETTGWLWNTIYSHSVLRNCEVRDNGYDTSAVANKNCYSQKYCIFYLTSKNVTYAGAADFYNCLFVGNGQKGGTLEPGDPDSAIRIATSDPISIDNCTFSGNYVSGKRLICFERISSPYGSGFKPGLRNCIIDHTSPQVGFSNVNKTYAFNTLFRRTLEEDSSVTTFTNYATFDDDGTVLGVDPKFADAANGDYHLTAASTDAIDKGATLGWMTAEAKDLDGNARVVGYQKRKDAIPDIGCYELPYKAKGLSVLLR